MIRLRGLLILSVLVLSAPLPAYSDFEPTPEITFIGQSIIFGGYYPQDMDAIPRNGAVIMAEISNGGCCFIPDDEVRVTISVCIPPRGDGFKPGDAGVTFTDSITRIDGQDFHDGLLVELDEIGCTLPIDGTPIDVNLIVTARPLVGTGTSTANLNWTFFATGSSSSPTPPAANQPPEFELTAVNPRPLVPGQPRIASGRGITTNTRVLFNTGEVDTTYNSSTGNVSFLVPEGIYCGEHTVQLRNPGGEREYSNILTFTITRDCVDPDPFEPPRLILLPPPTLTLPDFSIESLSPESGNPGTNVIVNGYDFIEAKSVVLFNDDTTKTDFISSEQLRFTVPIGTPCGRYKVKVRKTAVRSDESNEVTFTVTQPCTSQGSGNPPPEDPPNEDPPPNPPPPPNDDPQPPPANADEVEEFDTNGDCRISNEEFFAAVDRWIGGTLDNSVFFAILDAWISESNICSAASVNDLVKLSRAANGSVFFESQLAEATAMAVAVFDLNGHLVFQNQTFGRKLRWNPQVANGVYLVAMQIRSSGGKSISTETRKLILQR